MRKLEIIENFCYTITTKQVRVPNAGILDIGNGKYRYLTEKEVLLLMGFEEEDYKILAKLHNKKENAMNTILYKQAGNSIVVNILESIIKNIAKKWKIKRKTFDFSWNVCYHIYGIYKRKLQHSFPWRASVTTCSFCFSIFAKEENEKYKRKNRGNKIKKIV